MDKIILELKRNILTMLSRAENAPASSEAAEYAKAASELVYALSHASLINLGEKEELED